MTAIGVPVLYVLGRGYADGYWRTLGLSSSLMDGGVDVYLYLGFVAVITSTANLIGLTGSNTMVYMLGGGITLAAVASLLAAIDQWAASSFRQRLKVVEKRTANWRAKHHGWLKAVGYPAAVIGAGFYALFFLVLTLLLVILFTMVLVEKSGAKAATSQLKRYSEYAKQPRGKPPIANIRYVLDGQLRRGLLLDCSSRWCVAYEADGFVAVPAGEVKSISAVPTPQH